jgi:small nuclear ribonucleoprotein (snRNP)-like protein
MRRLLALVLCFLLLTAELFAKTRDWKNLDTLKPGDSITITLKDGKKLSGEFDSHTNSTIRMAVYTSRDSGFGSFREIEREKIRKLIRINDANLPDPNKLMAAGAVVGGAAGAIVGAAKAPSNSPKAPSVLLGGLAGAVLGFLGAAVVGLGMVTHALVHHSTVIYQANQ